MILLTEESLVPDHVTEAVRSPANGGVVTFLGVTRDNTSGRQVRYLEYEAYEPMAEAKLAGIAAEISEEWPVEDIAIALGGHGEHVTKPEEIGPAIERAMASGKAAVVNVEVEQHAMPGQARFGGYSATLSR